MMLLLGQNIESANWWSGNDAIYLMTIATMVYSGIVAAFGMKWYARVQYILYWIAMIGVFVVIVAFAISSHSTFVANFNTFWTNRLGYSGANAYQDIIDAAKEQGLGGVSQVNWDWGLAAPLLPLNLMWGLWSTWAAPLYGEVRGVKSFWKTHLSFQMTNIPLNFLNILVILGIWSIASNEFYQSANYLFWMGDTTHMPMFASVPFWSYLLTGNVALTVFIHLSIIAWYSLLNGAGNTYLIISRFMFAMSYDQALPSWFASLKTSRRIPAYSYLWCFLITLVLGWFYSYNWHGFRSLFLDASFAFVVVFCFTSLVAILLPFTRRSIFKASPAAKYVIGGIPIQVICGIGFIGMSIYVIYQWLVDANYGVNSPFSAQVMVLLYAIGVIIFLAFKYYRKSKGIDLNLTYQQIPPD